MQKTYDYLIMGSGLYGAVFAHEMNKAGKRCLVIDKRDHAGGDTYCENVDGINVHNYGAHIFHTNDAFIWKFVNRFVPFNRYTNSPLAPFNMNTSIDHSSGKIQVSGSIPVNLIIQQFKSAFGF